MDPEAGCGVTDAILPREAVSSYLGFPVRGQLRAGKGLRDALGMTGRHSRADPDPSHPLPGHRECLYRLPLFSPGCAFSPVSLRGLRPPPGQSSASWPAPQF